MALGPEPYRSLTIASRSLRSAGGIDRSRLIQGQAYRRLSVASVIGFALSEDPDDFGVEGKGQMLSRAGGVAPVDVERAFDLKRTTS